MNPVDTDNNDGNTPAPSQKQSPRKIKRQDAAYIDKKLRETFIRGHAVKVHKTHMDLVRDNARRNARRKIP